jgi:C4-dicarboxylate-specific signal transduction histidine kinase
MDDELMFMDESEDESYSSEHPWRILIVDDDPDIHTVTKLALAKVMISDRPLEFTSVYSAKEARELLDEDEDFALLFLDIVMESDHAGLDVVQHIRNELKNSMIRIIIRTGEPGTSPERMIIDNYDINDYKEKTELSATKLYTTIRSSLLQFEQLESLYVYQNSLETIIEEKAKKINIQEMALFESNKQAQMGELLSMIAHQWRQPLSRIGAVIGQMKMGVSLETMNSEELEKNLDTAENHIQHLSRIIKEFQNLYFPDEKKSYVSLSSIVQNGLNILKDSFDENGIKLELDNSASSSVNINMEFQQVFVNIIKNAFDVLLDREVKDALVTVSIKEEGKTLIVEIEDNAGLVNTLDDKIFEPYVSSSEEKNGKGLGLYISKMIVEKHCQGSIHVEMGSAGACFKIEVPTH